MTWEIEWDRRRRRGQTTKYFVWARNPEHKMEKFHEWRWVTQETIRNAGVPWRAKARRRQAITRPGRVMGSGYVYRGPWSMTDEEVDLCDRLALWYKAGGTAKPYVHEHRLVAAKKYGAAIVGQVVRHLNGVKNDNRPENLVIGSHKENHNDHNTARTEMMYWRERAEKAEYALLLLSAVA